MVRGGGDYFACKVYCFRSFLVLGKCVSGFLRVMVSWFLGFLVSKFLIVKDSKIPSCFRKILVPYYRISISFFLVDIGLISKIFKILLDGSSGLFVARLLEICPNSAVPKFRDL